MKKYTPANLDVWTATGENHHKVSKKQWKKWGMLARRVFNAMMSDMEIQKYSNTSPLAPIIHDTHWGVIRWNAAFNAALAVQKFVDMRIGLAGHIPK